MAFRLWVLFIPEAKRLLDSPLECASTLSVKDTVSWGRRVQPEVWRWTQSGCWADRAWSSRGGTAAPDRSNVQDRAAPREKHSVPLLHQSLPLDYTIYQGQASPCLPWSTIIGQHLTLYGEIMLLTLNGKTLLLLIWWTIAKFTWDGETLLFTLYGKRLLLTL